MLNFFRSPFFHSIHHEMLEDYAQVGKKISIPMRGVSQVVVLVEVEVRILISHFSTRSQSSKINQSMVPWPQIAHHLNCGLLWGQGIIFSYFFSHFAMQTPLKTIFCWNACVYANVRHTNRCIIVTCLAGGQEPNEMCWWAHSFMCALVTYKVEMEGTWVGALNATHCWPSHV